MFTGIVQAVGAILEVQSLGQAPAGVRLTLAAGDLDLNDVKPGDSIAIQGACMTVTSLQADAFTVDVSLESLSKTAGLNAPGPVNLEKAVALGERLGGHLMSGHVDGIGQVLLVEPAGESTRLVIQTPPALGTYFAYKGSVAIDGVSLTVNTVTDHPLGTDLSINVIPHTLRATTLGRLVPGMPVNVEVDLIARYCQRMLSYRNTV